MSGAPEFHVIVEARTDLGESPVWDARTQRLYFIDINSKNLQFWDSSTSQHTVISCSEMIGTVIPTSDPDTVLVGLERTMVTVDVNQRTFGSPLLTVPEDHGVDQMRFNDGKASPSGKVIIGRMHAKWRDGNLGRLYSADVKRGHLEELLPSVGLPNGMAWDMQRHIMYFVDTYSSTITAYPCDDAGVPTRDASGSVSGQEVVKVPQSEGIPDGLTIDSEGKLWVALAEGGAVACYDPDSGRQLQKVMLPVKKPTACTFGGADLDQLFVTTRIEKGKDASEHWGAVLAARIPGVKGAAGAYAVPL